MSDQYGHRLLCSTLHDEAARNPDKLFAISAKTNDIADGYHYISFDQISRATNYVAAWLLDRFEHGDKPTPETTLAYVGVSDIRYNIIFYAAIQCRYKLFVPSSRNSLDVNISLLESTKCSRLVYALEVDAIVQQLRFASSNLDCEQLLPLTDLLNVPETVFTYEFEFTQLSKEAILVLHSSGTTGFLKLIVWTHGSIATLDYRDWPVIEGRRNHDFAASLTFTNQGRLLDFFPPFHAGFVMFKVLTPIWNLTVPIFGPASMLPNGALAAQIMRGLKPDGIVLPPIVCEQLLREPDCEELLEGLQFVMSGGGSLSRMAGEKIISCTTLIQAFACTESPHIRQLVTQPEDWEYIEFHPNERVELQSRDDDLFELVFQIKPEYERDLFVYHTFPSLSTWSSRDLFKRHPTKPNLYRFYGRLEDMIVLSGGAVHPVPMELALTAQSGIIGALLVGQGYPQPILLLELECVSDRHGMSEEIWSAVETANMLMPVHGRVLKDMIIVADPQRPFKRAGKGTVIRKLTEDLYIEDIQNLFAQKAPT